MKRHDHQDSHVSIRSHDCHVTVTTHPDGVLAEKATETAGAVLDAELLPIRYVSTRSVVVVLVMKL